MSPWLDQRLPEGWHTRARPSDLGTGRLTTLARRVLEALVLVVRSRRLDALVISTASIEMLVLCVLRPLLGRCALVAYDPLLPAGDRLRGRVARLSGALDLVLCIRRADAETWAGSRRVEFVPFLAPRPAEDEPAAARDEPAVYAAGDTHRDYDLLVAGLHGTGLRATLCTGRTIAADAPDTITVHPPVSPEEGRRHQRESGITAVLLQDTDLPAGPLVLLDAMAAGAAIVCSRSPGLVDYVDDEVEALVLPAGATPSDVRDALARLAADPGLRVRLGLAARDRLAGPLASSRTIERCADLVGQVARRRPIGRRRSPGA